MLRSRPRPMRALPLALAAIFSLVACGGDSEEEGDEWRMNIGWAPGDVKTEAAIEFARELEELSNGDISILEYPGSTLMPSEDAAQELSSGTLAIMADSAGFFEGVAPFTRVLSVPFREHDNPANLIQQGTRAREILDEALAESNLKLVAAWESGPIGVVSTEPLETVEDLDGQPLRAGSVVAGDCLKEAGASIVVLSGSEAVDAMRRGIIVGSTIDQVGVQSRGYDDFADYFVKWEVQPNPSTIMMNLDEFEALSPELQEAVMDAGAAVSERAVTAVAEADEAGQAELESAGMTMADVDPEERLKLSAMCDDIVADSLAEIGSPDAVEEFLAEIEQ